MAHAVHDAYMKYDTAWDGPVLHQESPKKQAHDENKSSTCCKSVLQGEWPTHGKVKNKRIKS